MRIRKTRAGTQVVLQDVESGVLGQAVRDLLGLLGEGQDAPTDPLAALVGLPPTDAVRPSDPALARLLPDAYGDDPEASTELRRYTEADLREGKRVHARAVLASLPDADGTVVLDRDQADAWLGSLNDLRLVLGTRLGVTQDAEPTPGEDGPAAQALAVYHWLGWVQESLLDAIEPR